MQHIFIQYPLNKQHAYLVFRVISEYVVLIDKEVYCGNISACWIKLVLSVAASYKLLMRGGDLVGAYLVTRANKDYPAYIKTPQGLEMDVPAGYCIQAVGNLYGFPPAGQNFSIEFDKCVKEHLGPQALLQMDQRQAPVCHSSQR